MPLEDALPAPLAAYYDAIDNGRLSDAAACFTADAIYAAPQPGDIETGPRDVTVGATALEARFLERGVKPWRHVPILVVSDGPDTLVEGLVEDETGAATATFVLSARSRDGRLIDRFLAFSCAGARDPIRTDVASDVEPASAAKVVHDYFSDLEDGRFDEAAARFSADVLYSHPPYRHTGIADPDRVELRGRGALETAFNNRGRTSFDHEVTISIQSGPHCMFEGKVNNLPGGASGSFISSLTLARDGTIRRYVSFYCEPAVPSR